MVLVEVEVEVALFRELNGKGHLAQLNAVSISHLYEVYEEQSSLITDFLLIYKIKSTSE